MFGGTNGRWPKREKQLQSTEPRAELRAEHPAERS